MGQSLELPDTRRIPIAKLVFPCPDVRGNPREKGRLRLLVLGFQSDRLAGGSDGSKVHVSGKVELTGRLQRRRMEMMPVITAERAAGPFR